MMGEKKLVPKRRFEEFNGDWYQEILGEVVEITMGQSPNSANYTDNPTNHILVQGNADLKNNKVVPRVWTTEITKMAKKDDLILSVRAPVGDIGKTDYEVVLGRGVAGIHGNEFIYQLLTKMKKNKYWDNLSTGSTFESINSHDIKLANILIPDAKEQQKIGQFFKHLDEMIALQQRKIDKAKALKSAYLAEMFPAKGEHVPKRRFEEFNVEWNKKTISEISDSFSGGTPSAGNKMFYGGRIPFIRSGEVNSENTQLYITNEGLESSSAKLVEKGDILYALYGATSGEVGISKINGAINQAVLAIKPKYGDSSYFITQWLRKQKKTIIETYLQGGQGNLSGSIVKQLIIYLPNDKKEQQKIGQFFKHLDEMIATHQQKLEKLKATKQAYLHEMFV